MYSSDFLRLYAHLSAGVAWAPGLTGWRSSLRRPRSQVGRQAASKKSCLRVQSSSATQLQKVNPWIRSDHRYDVALPMVGRKWWGKYTKAYLKKLGKSSTLFFETWRAGLDTRMSANLLPFARSAPLMGDDHCPSHSGHSQILPLLCSRKFPSFSSKSSTTFPGTSSTANHALPHRASSKRFVRHTIWIHLVSRAMAVVLWEYPLYFQCLWSTCIKGMRKDKTYLISRVFLQITSNYRSY